MNPQPNRLATPSEPPISLKRKERDSFKPPAPIFTKSLKRPPLRNGSTHAAKSVALTQSGSDLTHKPALSPRAAKPESNNLLLAAYMAREFLTKGTILGDKIEPVRAAAVPLAPVTKSSRPIELSREADERYAEVTSLLRTDGAQIPEIVNPTQLARYLGHT